MWDQIAPDQQAARTRQQLMQPVNIGSPEPGIFSNFGPSAGNYFMRSMAEAGRGLSMAASAVPVLLQKGIDAIDPNGRINDRSLSDSYFKWHDETFNSAVDYWTPKPSEVGMAGQVVGTLAGGLTQFMANPALMLNTAQMSVGEDLVRQGVDPNAAVAAGGVAGFGAAIGIKLPIIGNTLGQRVAAGVLGNVGQGAATAGATQAILNASSAPAGVAAQFDPFDVKARTVDALMGAAFGGLTHMGAKPKDMPQSDRDAVTVVNQARHLEDVALPHNAASGADLSVAVQNVRTAIDQMLKGEPVNVAGEMPAMQDSPAKVAERAAIARIVGSEPAAPVIERPPMIEQQLPDPEAKGPQLPKFDDSVLVPSGEFDPKTGDAVYVKANDVLQAAARDAESAKQTAPNLLATAANCLLGMI